MSADDDLEKKPFIFDFQDSLKELSEKVQETIDAERTMRRKARNKRKASLRLKTQSEADKRQRAKKKRKRNAARNAKKVTK